jgi:hypothetical protein
MNYKTYKTMTAEQQKEWEFKYKDAIHLNLSSLPGLMVGLLSIVTLYLMTSYLFFVDPKFEQYQPLVISLMANLSKVVSGVGFAIIILAIVDLFHIIIRIISEKRWLKRNNIKEQMSLKEKLKDIIGG